MALITKSIGTTARDYATITLWEAAFGGAAGGGGDTAKGECYDDSAFDEAITFNESTPDDAILSVASGERHDGTEGTGARLVMTATQVITVSPTIDVLIEWLEVDHNGNAGTILGTTNTAALLECANLIVHGISGTTAAGNGAIGVNDSRELSVRNCFVYDYVESGDFRTAHGILGANFRLQEVFNCSVHDIQNDNATSGNAYGITTTDSGDDQVRNCIATDTGGSSGGTFQDYFDTGPGSATYSHNLASDTSASGTGSLDSKTSANQFVSNSAPYDLHIKAGADAIDVGTDLGAVDAAIDINGRNRDTEGDVWDMGAHELVGAAPDVFVPQVIMI